MSTEESERVVSVSSRGQATIPKEYREKLGIEAPGRVKFVETATGEVVVQPIESVTDLRGTLAGKTDDSGRTATELLREERSRDRDDDQIAPADRTSGDSPTDVDDGGDDE
ncbi:AbrB/MazE/SpoVT family DNA-binding domain-containing protein [Halobaculum sp. MBLA0147]|uniref:AbrB/MazE/SpoVT family DNA-binding domain-containing protein n=1 Tax=Halobaculum sp. MBLA0147 TaxID=3079934 RepID=UPI0035267405